MAELTLSDLVTGRRRPDPFVGGARAILGQGLGMGWGDEAEAWLRSKLGGGSYESNLEKIREEYGQFSKENPITAGALEFGGGVVPGVAAMFIPGGQAFGAQQLARTGAGTMARIAASPMARATAAGAVTGGVTGAGSAEEGQRGSGAVSGTVLGGALGVATPTAIRGAKSAGTWLREKLAPTPGLLERRAAEKMTGALQESGLTPQDIEARMAVDRKMRVPSVVANVDPALADLAETVAQRTGRGTRIVEQRLTQQKAGARERTYQQTVKGLKPGDYYADEQKMVQELRDRAKTLYDDAYASGAIDDPRITEALKNPAFQNFFEKARAIADTEAMAAKLRGEDPSKYALPQLYKPSGRFDARGNEILELNTLPDVRTLDYIKRGIDATIDAGYTSAKGMSTAEATALKDLRKVFVSALDEAAPLYKKARGEYAGEMEVLDAMRTGMTKFGKLDHEQVIDLVSKMGKSEKEAFRTGVARDLYSKIMDPSGNFNAAQRIIGSPEMQAKLQPLFDSPAEYRLFQAAMEREAQLFHTANKILGGSQTGKRTQMAREFEAEPGTGEMLAQAVTGGFWSSLTGMAARAIRTGRISSEVADKLAPMLMSKDPNEVAAVVKVLENYAQQAAPRAARATATELGATTGAAASIFPSPAVKPTAEETDIEAAPSTLGLPSGGPSIEADIEAELKKRK